MLRLTPRDRRRRCGPVPAETFSSPHRMTCRTCGHLLPVVAPTQELGDALVRCTSRRRPQDEAAICGAFARVTLTADGYLVESIGVGQAQSLIDRATAGFRAPDSPPQMAAGPTLTTAS